MRMDSPQWEIRLSAMGFEAGTGFTKIRMESVQVERPLETVQRYVLVWVGFTRMEGVVSPVDQRKVVPEYSCLTSAGERILFQMLTSSILPLKKSDKGVDHTEAVAPNPTCVQPE